MMTAIFRRLCLSVLILFMVAVFVFMATEVLPGDALVVEGARSGAHWQRCVVVHGEPGVVDFVAQLAGQR